MSVFDLAELAADVGPNPRTIGVLLELEGPAPDPGEVRNAMRDRLGLVPRLAQRMRPVPLGSGRPVWEDVDVELEHHVRARSAADGDLLSVAAEILSEPLEFGRPWWTLTVIDLPTSARWALVWSSHHAMADGPSVLRAVLAVLQPGPERPLPVRLSIPGRRALTLEAWATRVRGAAGVGRLPLRLLGLRELAASSGATVRASLLNRPVTAGYVLRTVDVDLLALRTGAKRCGATVNDALLWAWGSALHRRLAAVTVRSGGDSDGDSDGDSGGNSHGLPVDVPSGAPDVGPAAGPVVVSCTITTPSAAIENRVGAVRFEVAAPRDGVARDLAALAAYTRRRKRWITGSPWWLIAQVFRAIGALGLYRRFVERQRSITSLLTNMRGPADFPSVLGRRVTRAVPLATLVGNVTVLAAALSCGGRLVVTVQCSPESEALLDDLTRDLRSALAQIVALAEETAPNQESALDQETVLAQEIALAQDCAGQGRATGAGRRRPRRGSRRRPAAQAPSVPRGTAR